MFRYFDFGLESLLIYQSLIRYNEQVLIFDKLERRWTMEYLEEKHFS